MADTPERDDQDQAEVLDETNLTRDGEDIANFDTLPDVLDSTSEVGDAGEDDGVDDGIETGEDLDAEQDADLSPRTRLEDRPDSDTQAVRPGPAWDDQVLDDDDTGPAVFEGGENAADPPLNSTR